MRSAKPPIDVVAGVNIVVKPGAAATVANTFSFPLALMVVVVLFLVIQPRVDRRDPRLRALAAASDERRDRVRGRGSAVTTQVTVAGPISQPALPGSTESALTSKAEFTSLSDRMSYLLVLRLAIGGIVAAWAVLRPEALVLPLDLGPRLDGRLSRGIAVAGEWARRPDRSIRLLDPDRTPPHRRPLSRGDDVRDRCHPEPDPIPRLPPPGRGVAPGVLPDRPQDRPLALAAAVRRRLRRGGPPRRPGRCHAGRRGRVRSDAGPQRHRRSGCSRSRRRSSRRSTSASFASAARTSSRSSTSATKLDTDRRRRPAVGHRAAGPGRSLRLRTWRPARGVGRPGRRPRDPRHDRRPRPPRPTPTGSSVAPGSVATRCRSSGSTRRATRCCRSLMPDARNVLVAPMIAEGRTLGAIVVEHRARRTGVERRVAAMLGQFASIAALNLRNAALLQHVQDLAERDSLTGAANRRMFQLSLERTLQVGRPRARGRPGDGRPLPRPRRLQDRQRHPRPRRRRRAPGRGHRADHATSSAPATSSRASVAMSSRS